MANTAPGTPYVESSDLVANYPAVSESLAERVDLVGILPFADSTARGTALPTPTDGQYSYLQDTNATEFWNGSAWVAAGTAPGLVHINTTTFSAVSSVSLNGVFTSTYNNYRITVTADMGSSAYIFLRWRVSGSDNNASSYARQQLTGRSTTAAASSGTDNAALLTFTSASGISTVSADIFNPQATANTVIMGNSNNQNPEVALCRNYFTATTSFDGFSLLAETGNMTGTVRVYAYKNS